MKKNHPQKGDSVEIRLFKRTSVSGEKSERGGK